jgi:hypothetical protein
LIGKNRPKKENGSLALHMQWSLNILRANLKGKPTEVISKVLGYANIFSEISLKEWYLITGWRRLGVDIGEVGLSSVEVVLKCVNECGKKRPGLKPAGLPDGKNSFHPAVALFTGGTLRALSPQFLLA